MASMSSIIIQNQAAENTKKTSTMSLNKLTIGLL